MRAYPDIIITHFCKKVTINSDNMSVSDTNIKKEEAEKDPQHYNNNTKYAVMSMDNIITYIKYIFKVFKVVI